MEYIEIFAKAAGIGGLSLAVFLLVFKEIIRKRIFPQLTKEQSYKLIKLILISTLTVTLSGIGAWVYIAINSGKDFTFSEKSVRRSFITGQQMAAVEILVRDHLDFMAGKEKDDLVDIYYTNKKMQLLQNLEFIGFDRNSQLDELKIKNLDQWTNVNQLWELRSRISGFIEKSSKEAFFLYELGSLLERANNAVVSKKDPKNFDDQIKDLLSEFSHINKNWAKIIKQSLANDKTPQKYINAFTALQETFNKQDGTSFNM